jgi:hypothetical protein
VPPAARAVTLFDLIGMAGRDPAAPVSSGTR